jgi:RNA ligase (TIGR02306 family)
MASELAYGGKIIDTQPIPDADRIVQVTVVCGRGGKWRGVMRKEDIKGDTVVVFLPDALLPQDNEAFSFMKDRHYRVKQTKFKGVASECLIMPVTKLVTGDSDNILGLDLTAFLKVEKYEKPGGLSEADSIGGWPPFLRRTDEPNFQRVPEMVEAMRHYTVYVTLKMDGSSVTAYRHEGIFGVCSRNLKVGEGDGKSRYWQPVKTWKLDELLSDGYAYQFETCGPGIQKNRMGLSKVEGFLFNIWDTVKREYIGRDSIGVWSLMQTVPHIAMYKPGEQPEDWQKWCEQLKYPNGSYAEGIVIRTMQEHSMHVDGSLQRFSYKVINLNYKE